MYIVLHVVFKKFINVSIFTSARLWKKLLCVILSNKTVHLTKEPIGKLQLNELSNLLIKMVHSSIIQVCKSIIGERVRLIAHFMDRKIPLANTNSFGDIAENLLYSQVQLTVTDFHRGPLQASPDFFGEDKHEYELKLFTKQPSFDIGNFSSYVESITTLDGMQRKLCNTTYLVFRYEVQQDEFVFKEFWELPVWKLCAYGGKNGLSVQIKRGQLYNIRPGPSKKFDDTSKTVHSFLDALEVAMERSEIPDDVRRKVKASRAEIFPAEPPQQLEEQPYCQKDQNCCKMDQVGTSLETLISGLTLYESGDA